MKMELMDGNQMADHMEHIATLLGGTELSAIDSNVRTDLLTAIGTLPASLATSTADAQIARDQAEAFTSVKNGLFDQNLELGRMVRDQLRASRAPKPQFDMCGFDYPFGPRGVIVAAAPTALTVAGTSNGVNSGSFKGNNENGSVTYQIWRQEGDEGPWGIHLTTTKQKFTDTPVTAGQYYAYKVRAVATSNTSPFSEVVVVYGT